MWILPDEIPCFDKLADGDIKLSIGLIAVRNPASDQFNELSRNTNRIVSCRRVYSSNFAVVAVIRGEVLNALDFIERAVNECTRPVFINIVLIDRNRHVGIHGG